MSNNIKPVLKGKFNTPKGKFKFPRLNEPDTKFKEEGEFSVKLVMDKAQVERFLAAKGIDEFFDEAIAWAKAEYAALPVATRKKTEFRVNDLYTPVYDPETEEETGEVEMSFKMRASGVSKKTGKPWERKPTIFDAKGNPMVKPPQIWGGTIGKISFTADPYYTTTAGAGLSFRMEAAQIIDLVTGGSRSAADFGFEEEDGYEYEEQAEVADGEFGDETQDCTGEIPEF